MTLAAILGVLDIYEWVTIPSAFLTATRWITWALFIWLAIRKRSLTTWIVVSMFIGCEIGFSFPAVALHLNTLSGIFLRLIKTIIAPLLFSTLVVGIAAHSNLKQVGRMGLKAILYFEVVTTIALFIGLGAINLTRAGEGAVVAVQEAQEQRAEKLIADKKSHDVILDIFPENFAKAVSEGQVLQVVE